MSTTTSRTLAEVVALIRAAWETNTLWIYDKRHVLVPNVDGGEGFEVLWDMGASRTKETPSRREMTWAEIQRLNQMLKEAGAHSEPGPPESPPCHLGVLCGGSRCWRGWYTDFVCNN